MTNYKNSGIEWIGDIPKNWRVNRLKIVLQERNENNNPIKTDYILSLTNDRGVIPYTDKGEIGNKSKDDISGYKLAYPNDIVLNSMNVIIGSVGISKYYGAVSPVYYMLKPRYDSDDVRFYNYIFQTNEFQNRLKGYGNGILEIRMRIQMLKLNTVELPIPPSEEQFKIANFLDRKCSQIDALISLEEKEIEKLKEYKQSVISEIVVQGLNKTTKMKNIDYFGQVPDNWDIIPLKILFDFGKGLPITKENLIKNGIKVISYGQIHSKSNKSVEIDDSLYRFVSDEYLDTNQNSLVHYGDFVFADTSEDLEGTGDFIHIDNNDTVFAGYHTISLINKNNIYSNYLAFQFMTDLWKSQLRSRVNGVKVFSITKRMLSQCFVVLPPQNEQKSIVNALNNKCKCIDDLIKIKNKKIEELETYKRSTIYEYVTGKKRCI